MVSPVSSIGALTRPTCRGFYTPVLSPIACNYFAGGLPVRLLFGGEDYLRTILCFVALWVRSVFLLLVTLQHNNLAMLKKSRETGNKFSSFR